MAGEDWATSRGPGGVTLISLNSLISLFAEATEAGKISAEANHTCELSEKSEERFLASGPLFRLIRLFRSSPGVLNNAIRGVGFRVACQPLDSARREGIAAAHEHRGRQL